MERNLARFCTLLLVGAAARGSALVAEGALSAALNHCSRVAMNAVGTGPFSNTVSLTPKR